MLRDTILDGHILNIIQNNEIIEQSELQKILKERGYDIPQATLSRHLKKLKIAKVSGIYKIIDFNQSNLPIILNMKVSESGIIVLHTHPGNASSLAYFFDQKYVSYFQKNPKKSSILGTVAGDDTVLLIIKSIGDLENTLCLIYEDFPYLRGISK